MDAHIRILFKHLIEYEYGYIHIAMSATPFASQDLATFFKEGLDLRLLHQAPP